MVQGTSSAVTTVQRGTTYAVGFARPDRRSWAQPADQPMSWHAVEAHRPADELDGEVELAVCGAIVQVWGSQDWERLSAGRAGCAECRQRTAAPLRHAV